MIVQFKFEIDSKKEVIKPYWAYWLYSWLLNQADTLYAQKLHDQGEKPISQYIHFDKYQRKNYWTVNLLNEEATSSFYNILDSVEMIELNKDILYCKKTEQVIIESNEDLFKPTSEIDNNYLTIRFLSPTSFKQNNQYVLFPSVWLILQSLIKKWNKYTPTLVIDDNDAINMLINGVRINRYSLYSSAYSLKNNFITGFKGSIGLKERLPLPMYNIYNLLMEYSPYCGIGIKSSLGMGGVIIEK